ncbi:hypothetical protein Tco_0132810 [Tanacetum coccineum]
MQTPIRQTKRYMPIDKSSASKKPERQIPQDIDAIIMKNAEKSLGGVVAKITESKKPEPEMVSTKDEIITNLIAARSSRLHGNDVCSTQFMPCSSSMTV